MNLSALLRLLLPRRRTTDAEVRAAMVNCGIAPGDIVWAIGVDGSFTFGRKSPTDQTFSPEQSMCLVEWAQRERVKVRFIGWETGEK
jgi:hypothetical protein